MSNSMLQQTKNAAIALQETQLQLGKQLQAEGLQIIKSLQNSEASEKAEMLKAATATIEKGCNIVTKAMDKIIQLKQ